MAIRTSRYYNDPSIGAAFDNIAQMFAPPESGDMANYAQAKETNQRTGIISKLAGDPRYQSFDFQGMLANLFDAPGTMTAVQMANDTSRSNNAADNQRAIVTNAADNTRLLAQPRFNPLQPGEMLPAVDPALSSMFDLPALSTVAGPAKPLSETEVKGLERQQLTGSGKLTQDDLLATILGDVPVENTVGPDGKPVIMRRNDAVGMQPYFNKGAEAKPENAVAQLSDGTMVAAIQGDDGKWRHAQTGAELPADIQIFKVPAPQGSAADVGLGKPTANYIDRALIDIAVAKDTAVKLRDLIAAAPASQGIVGMLRGTAQNVIQTGGEVGKFFGGQAAEVAKAIESGAADAGLAGEFDPNIPAIQMMANLLAFQYAKTTTGERLSNEMLKAARAALGLDGLDANQANSLARLNQAINQIASQEEILKKAKGEGVNALSAAGDPGATDLSVPPDGVDPADWAYLSDAEKAEFVNGN